MENNECWYCGRNQAESSVVYPKPYVVVTFRNHSPEKKLGNIGKRAPRCIDCARAHLRIEAHNQFHILFIPTLITFFVLFFAHELIAFEDDSFIYVPSILVFIITFVYLRYRKNKILRENGTKKFTDTSQYMALLEPEKRENYTINPYVDLDDMLTRNQRKTMIGLKETKEPSTLPPESVVDRLIDVWKPRIGQSIVLILFGTFWVGFGFIGIELFGVTGPEGAVMIDGGLVFMPLGSALTKYLILFVCGIGLVVGYPAMLIGLVGFPLSVVLTAIGYLRGKIRQRNN